MSAVVSPEWLLLREPADAAARSAELAERLARQLNGPLVIHDLGGGSGAMGRWLAPRLPGPQHWVVHDRDPDLLELALADPPPGATVEVRQCDIARLTARDAVDLVTASALLDLLTADELDRMLAAYAGLPMLLALTVTGHVSLDPADPLDARIEAAFNDHQRRDGRLGPDAVDRLDGLVRPSPWRLAPGDLMVEWLHGWVAAACEQDPELDAGAYLERRLAQEELTVTVDHADVLVLP
jgi:Methyltransferase domain